ncbi:MAG TPA: NADH-quinone oxidoreductase subunit H [Bacteroidales bacterium]|nr:NADH-quinone oxidoreductase subunit H [Bacteroidales bacterium]HQI45808.1 NADH-quinone oxidoreductase subunit H [Bacteroidales bacterium]
MKGLGFIIIFLSSFFFLGIITRVKSIASGRKGPGLFQPMWDIFRLLKKGTIYSSTTSFIFKIAPIIYFATILSASFLLPFHNEPGLLSFQGDFIAFSYMLALGKFFMIIAALDTGSAFQGMGASREALYSLLVEPAFFILFASFAMFTGYTSFYEIYNSIYFASYIAIFAGVLAAYNLFQIIMIENSRVPYDDPKTHLELTMIHEVMVLDNSGFDLALIQFASSLKFVIFGTLISNFFFTPDLSVYMGILIFIVIQFLFAVIVGIAESFRARHKLRNNNKAIVILTPISILIFLSMLMLITNQI